MTAGSDFTMAAASIEADRVQAGVSTQPVSASGPA